MYPRRSSKPRSPAEQGLAQVKQVVQTSAGMYAAASGHCATVELLLHRGADPSAVCQRGRTALHYACSHDKPAVVAQLVRTGRNIAVNALSHRSALVIAVE